MSAETVQVGSREIELFNQDKLYFPEARLTKGDLVDYYRRIADWMLPHLAGRPLTLERYPDGVGSEGFYQKDAPGYFPDWIARKELQKSGGSVSYVICNNRETLVYLANQGCVTPHVSLSRGDKPLHPDRLVFDLDPSGERVEDVQFAAALLRDCLQELGLASYLMTTGSRGFHVVVPLDRELGFDEVREFAREAARWVASQRPDRLTIEPRKSQRRGRVFLDYLRNAYGQTAVAPYAVRANARACVATPLAWHELNRELHPRKYDITNLFRRLGQIGDPWRSMRRHEQGLAGPRRKLARVVEHDQPR